MQYPVITLNKGKEKSLERFHPWVFSGAIKTLPEGLQEGDLVTVKSIDGKFLGIGHYQIGSIAVLILSFEPLAIDADFWKERLREAIALRKQAGLWQNTETNVFRLIHGEGDGFPGLIVDHYAGCLVFQAHTVGMYLIREMLKDLLVEALGNSVQSIYDKSADTLPYKAAIEPKDGFLYGPEKAEWLVTEYGNRFNINIVTGQKTGFFVDQRENRKLLERYSKGQKVLNTFCYSGGFSVSALKAGASLVHSVDSSAPAMALTDQNIALNFNDDAPHTSYCEDVFQFLNEMPEQYDVIVLDPPAFTKHKRTLKKGLNGYRTINEKAIKHMKSGGILFTFSCSQIVTQEQFRTTLFSAAARAHRKVQVLHQLHQPADHPVNIFHPEGEYLKGLVVRVI